VVGNLVAVRSCGCGVASINGKRTQRSGLCQRSRLDSQGAAPRIGSEWRSRQERYARTAHLRTIRCRPLGSGRPPGGGRPRIRPKIPIPPSTPHHLNDGKPRLKWPPCRQLTILQNQRSANVQVLPFWRTTANQRSNSWCNDWVLGLNAHCLCFSHPVWTTFRRPNKLSGSGERNKALKLAN